MNTFSHYSIEIIKRDIEKQVEYREWLRREIKKKNPYKCYGVKSKIKLQKKRFAKDIISQNVLISQLRESIKILNIYLI